MVFNTIISAAELAKHLKDRDWVVIDARFKLADPGEGLLDYEHSHIPGAVYAHLDHDLSGRLTKGVTGRHPLPSIDHLTEVFSRLGIDSQVQVVSYDDVGGALAAARMWWLLRWLGHDASAVLDGGWQEWLKLGLPVSAEKEWHERRKFIPRPRDELIVSVADVDRMRLDTSFRVLDARSSDRYHGENETIDPIAGHIPGAVSAPYAGNLNPDGTFRADDRICARYNRLIGSTPIDHVICYCGSGVTAAHDVLAMMKAGMGEAKLYAGSYSEWITDPKRPVEK